jgi:hypothetical protein
MNVSAANHLKNKIAVTINTLPPEGLKEVLNFLDYVRFKFQKKPIVSTPYIPIALGGIWRDENLDDTDIDEVRKEMWGNPERGQANFFAQS